MSLQTLKEQLKSGQFGQLYVLYGPESYLRKYYCQQIIDKNIEKDFEDFNLNQFDGKEFDFDAFAAAVESYPMMSQHKVVVVRELTPPTCNAKLVEKLGAALENMAETTICIFTFDPQHDLEKEKKFASQVKMLKQAGALFVPFQRPGEHDLARWVMRHFAAEKKRIDSKDAYYLLSICDNSMESLQNEIAKICTYAATDVITRKQIDAMATPSVEATVYQLSDALLDKQYDRAYHILGELFYLRTEPVLILGSLTSTFLTVYKVKALQESGAGREEILSLAGIRRPSLWNMYARMAGKVDMGLLQFILKDLAKADGELKGSKLDSRTVLELLLGSILAYDQGKTGAQALLGGRP